MPARSQIDLRGLFESLPSGSRSIAPTSLVNSDAPYGVTQITLASGDNTITIPTKATGCIIAFDPTSTTVKTLKGVGGDTGVVLAKAKWNVITFDSTPPANFIINSGAADTSKLTEIMFF